MGAAQSQPQEEDEETPAPAPAAPPRPESPVPPLAEHPTAYLIGDGASCMTRDRGEILALHGQGRCFGRVRGVGGAEAQRHWAELVLSPEETLYLTERNLLTVYDDQRESVLRGTEAALRRRRGLRSIIARLRVLPKQGMGREAGFPVWRRLHPIQARPTSSTPSTPWLCWMPNNRRSGGSRRRSLDWPRTLENIWCWRASTADIFELVVDDAFARPADALAGRRAPVQKGAKAHSKKRKRKESGQGMAPPDTPVEGASP